jgi:hypothetical protein
MLALPAAQPLEMFDSPRTPDISPLNPWTFSFGVVEEDRRLQLASAEKCISHINDGDMEKMYEYLSNKQAYLANFATYLPDLNACLLGLAGLCNFHKTLRTSFPDLNIYLHEAVPDGQNSSRLCVRCFCNGTQMRSFVPSIPLGERLNFSMLCFMEFNMDAAVVSLRYSFSASDPLLSLISSLPASSSDKKLAIRTADVKQLNLSDDDSKMFMKKLEEIQTDRSLMSWIVENAWALALTSEGSRLLQKALEVANVSEQGLLLDQFRGRVLHSAASIHANHVLQKAIEILTPNRIEFIVDECRGHVVEVAQNRCGCRVVERLLEHCPVALVGPLVDELLVDPLPFCKHPFSNFVMQHVVQYAAVQHQVRVARAMAADIYRLAKHRIASNVVGCALQHCDVSAREELAAALYADPKALSDLHRHPRGSFVYRELRRISKI